jgi:hypothetical protein
MPSSIPVRVDGRDVPSLNQARLHYRDILHRNPPGKAVNEQDQSQIKGLMASACHDAQARAQIHAQKHVIRVVIGKYGRHCFAAQDPQSNTQLLSIMRSVKQCASLHGPETPHSASPAAS